MSTETTRPQETHRGRYALAALLAVGGLGSAYVLHQNAEANRGGNGPDLRTGKNTLYLPPMDNDQDTTPGFNPYTQNETLTNNPAVAELIQNIWAKYTAAETDQDLLELKGEYVFEQVLTGETVFHPDRRLDVENMGLGFTENTLAQFGDMETNFRRFFTNESLAAVSSNQNADVLTFNGNPAENGYWENVLVEENGINRTFGITEKLNNVHGYTLIAALDTLKTIKLDNGQTAWDSLTPAQRLGFAVSVSEGLFNQHIAGAYGESSTFTYTQNGENRPLFSAEGDELGYWTCRVQMAPNSVRRSEQKMTTQRVDILEQDSNTDLKTPFSENSLYGSFAIAYVVNTHSLSQQFGSLRGTSLTSALAEGILTDEGAFEIFDMSTGHETIPGGWEYNGADEEEGDQVNPFIPCGPIRRAQPVIVPTEVPPVYVPPTEVPPTYVPPTEVYPTPTPTYEPPKDDAGNQVNPDGETQNAPTGGVINDPNAEQGSAENPGSGR